MLGSLETRGEEVLRGGSCLSVYSCKSAAVDGFEVVANGFAGFRGRLKGMIVMMVMDPHLTEAALTSSSRDPNTSEDRRRENELEAERSFTRRFPAEVVLAEAVKRGEANLERPVPAQRSMRNALSWSFRGLARKSKGSVAVLSNGRSAGRVVRCRYRRPLNDDQVREAET